MSSAKPLRRIVIVGDGMRAAMAAAYLAKACGRAGADIVVMSGGEAGKTGQVVVRPSALRFNAELGLNPAELCKKNIASPLFAAEMPSSNGPVTLPYAASGVASNGVEFHHYWLRASQAGFDSALHEYSLPLTLQNARSGIALESAAGFKIPFGLRIDRASYAQLLVNVASAAGVRASKGKLSAVQKLTESDWPMRLSTSDVEVDADFLVDVSEGSSAENAVGASRSGWSGRYLRIDSGVDLPGIEVFRLQRGLTRFASLIPGRGNAHSDSGEFNRIFHAEENRITDMACLLTADEAEARQRPALARKIDLFTACGRIPSEDYEVFQPCEWLAALMARGHFPERAERLAERMPETELRIWLESLRRQIADLRKQVEAA